ncbi:hypothetical protein MNV49_004205 [Pseudohyphozyma bogoriensis]|nr:hypothetical protein MNV49_004205 [Pseudohyphozyma bogoriensis]
MSSPSPSTGSPPQKKLKLVDTRSELDAKLDEERDPPTQSDDAGDEQEQGRNSTPNDDEEAKGADPCPITDLPLEILDKITSRMAWEDLENLAATCRGFRNLYRLPAILEKLDDEKYKWSLYCVEGAQKGEFGFEPFIIFSDNCRVVRDDSGWSSDDSDIEDDSPPGHYLVLDVVILSYQELHPDRPTKDYFFISQNPHELWFDWDLVANLSKEATAAFWSTQDFECIVWDEFEGNLRLFTPAIARERFTCPECEGKEFVQAGTRETVKRWPKLDYEFYPLTVGCPRCTIPYDVAVEILEEELEELMESLMSEEYESE